MRRSFYLASFLALASFCSCQEDIALVDESLNMPVVEISATIEKGVNTRTQLDGTDNNGVNWSENDKISVFLGNTNNKEFTLDSGEGTGNATFIGTGDVHINAGTETNTKTQANVAYYPYAADVALSCTEGYQVTASFPAEQTYAENSFGQSAAPMVAVTKDNYDNAFQFKNVGSIFKVELKKGTDETTISQVTLFSKANKLAGKYTVTASNSDVPTFEFADEAVNAITLNCGEGVALSEEGVTFVFAIPYQKYASGDLTFTFYTTGGDFMTFKSEKEYDIQRSTSWIIPDKTYEKSGSGNPVTGAEALQAALNSATSPMTVVLTESIVLAEPLTIPSGKTLTLDLNGYTISQEKECTESYSMVTNNGTLTITGNGKISFKDTGSGDSSFGWGSYTIANYGTLVIENGTIENLSEQNAQDKAVHMYCAIQQGHGAVSTTVNGGKISTPTYRSIRINTGALVVNGGVMEGQVWLQPNQGDATIEVKGGDFSPRGVDGSSIFLTNERENYTVTSASFTAGKFNTKIGVTNPNLDGVKGSVKGGVFTESAKSYTNAALIAEGYDFVEENGNYKVVYNAVAEVHYKEQGIYGYMTLEEAVSKALEDGTGNASVKVVKDITGFDADNTITIPNGKSLVLDLDNHTVAGISDQAESNREMFSVKGTLTVKNGTITTEHVGSNMEWNNSTNVFNVTAGGVLNLEDVVAENKGGSDMAFVAHLNNWGEVTLNAANTTFKSTYVGIRVFNSGPDKNNVTFDNCKIETGNSCIWVHNYVGADFGNKLYSGSNEAYDETKVRERLNFSFNQTAISRNNGSKSLVRFGYNNAIYYSNIEMTEVVAGTEAALAWALENGKNVILNNDIKLTSSIAIPAGSTITLDLNGKTISQTSETPVSMITNNGNLTIKDSGNSGKIAFTFNGTVDGSKAANAISNKGTLIVESGEISNTGTGNQIGYAIDNYNGSTLTVNGGKISESGSSYYDGIRLFCGSNETTVTVNGGEISTIWAQNPTANKATEVKGTVIINGGTINTTYYENYTTVKVKSGITATVTPYGAGKDNTTTTTEDGYTVYSFVQSESNE